MNYILYKDTTGQYRWQLQAANRKVIPDSGEGYHNKADCLSAIGLVMSTTLHTPITDTSGTR